MDASVRRSGPQDATGLRALMLEYIVDFYRQPPPAEEDLRRLIEMLADGREGVQFVADQDRELRGFATLYFSWSTFSARPTAVMNDLYVLESFRGSSVAADLFRACVDESGLRGCAEMTWETAPDNVRAQRFYEKVGGRREPWVTYAIDL